MPRTRISLSILLIGGLLFSGGAGMRLYADVMLRLTEGRLTAAKPNSLAEISAPPNAFSPADGQPSEIRLPSLDLWNQLEPVKQQVSWHEGQIALAWNVRDAGWHAGALPGWGLNVVVAGHSPSLDPHIWPRSVFRQLAYLSAGDRVELTAGSRIYVYAVERVFAVSAAEAETAQGAQWIAPGSAERLTLVTCWPPNTAAYRVVVIAQPIQMKERLYHEPLS